MPAKIPHVSSPPRGYAWWLWSGAPTFEGVCDALALQYAVLDELLQPIVAGRTGLPASADPWRFALHVARLTATAEEVVTVTREVPAVGVGGGADAGAGVGAGVGERSTPLDAVAWFRSEAATREWAVAEMAARSNAGRAVQDGARIGAAQHRAATALAVAILRSGHPDRPLGGAADGLDLAEFAVTRLVGAVVHGLDLAAELGRPGHADPRAAHIVSGFLAAVADRAVHGTAPAPIVVDGQGSLVVLAAGRGKARIPAVDWIQAATSRRPVRLPLPRSHDWLSAELPLGA